jgi:hypothetical protein
MKKLMAWLNKTPSFSQSTWWQIIASLVVYSAVIAVMYFSGFISAMYQFLLRPPG